MNAFDRAILGLIHDPLGVLETGLQQIADGLVSGVPTQMLAGIFMVILLLPVVWLAVALPIAALHAGMRWIGNQTVRTVAGLLAAAAGGEVAEVEPFVRMGLAYVFAFVFFGGSLLFIFIR